MIIAVIDGMGGGIGAEVVSQARKELSGDVTILALGINAVATEKMMQSRANRGASGENAIRFSINSADYIVGPVGIVLPNGLMGEVTKEIAEIIMSARGKKILIPVNHPNLKIIGLEQDSLSKLISLVIEELKKV